MPDVTITLTDDESLVLFEFLARFSDTDLLGTEDQAEQRAFWNLHCLLERQVVASFAPNYRDLLDTARDGSATMAALMQNRVVSRPTCILA